MGPSDTSFLGKMRSMAEASFEQGCRGFEKFLAGPHATAGQISARGHGSRRRRDTG